MNRISPSWALMLLALVLSLHLACSTNKPTQSPPALAVMAMPAQPPSTPPGMVFIPGGTFMMGCTVGDKKCSDVEKSAHQVLVSPFYMDKTEVTVGAYRKCVEAKQCLSPKGLHVEGEIIYGNWAYQDREEHPINVITWFHAKAYCQWAGKRLPAEAEWEYAARGGHSDWRYPWGNKKPNCNRAVMNGWFHGMGCGKESTWPVGSKGAYGFGLEDMEGNVAEWVEDCIYEYPNAPTQGGQDACLKKAKASCEKIMRGGTLYSDSDGIRVSARYYADPGSNDVLLGFRCAKSNE